jgi:hypothetical protein
MQPVAGIGCHGEFKGRRFRVRMPKLVVLGRGHSRISESKGARQLFEFGVVSAPARASGVAISTGADVDITPPGGCGV